MWYLAKLLMKGWLQNLLVAAIVGWLSIRFMPLAIVSAGVGAMYTLRKGFINGLTLFAIVGLITWGISLFVETRPGLEIPILIFIIVPVLLSSYSLLITQSQGYAVLVAAACGLFQAVSIQLLSGDAVAWWADWIKLAITGVQGATFEGFENDGTLNLFNGLAAMGLVMVTFLSVLLGRAMQASQVNPGGCQLEFCALQVPTYGFTLTILSAAIASIFSQYLMYDVLIIAVMMYFFQGLAVLHASVINKGLRKSYLIPAYILLLLAPQFAIVGFGMVGVLDVFLNFRKLPKPVRKQR